MIFVQGIHCSLFVAVVFGKLLLKDILWKIIKTVKQQHNCRMELIGLVSYFLKTT